MIDVEEIEKYLPYYLTDQKKGSLLKEIREFPNNIDQRFFTIRLKDEKNIFQGDGYSDFVFVNLQNPELGRIPAMVISNTCDIDQANKRLYPKRIVYAPIFQRSICAKLIVNSGIKQVIYKDGYHDEMTMDIFMDRLVKFEVCDEKQL